jgi:succinyl-diaminopimelate desuccinylase
VHDLSGNRLRGGAGIERSGGLKEQLIQMVERDRDEIIRFIQEFVRCKSPNPPGNTVEAAQHIARFLGDNGLPHEVVSPHPEMPNLLAATRFGDGGKHLILNGHIDVFPVETETGWTHGPWSGDLADGKIYGRGVADMKVGTTASIMTYRYLTRLGDQLKGKLTLATVSDEETFGPWGARFLFEHRRESVIGDACLIGEPSSAHTVRFGEKGTLWMRFTLRTKGAHGAYVHMSENALLLATEIIASLRELEKVEVDEASNLSASLDAAAAAIDRAYGSGAFRNVRRITVNVGRLTAGSKVNMVPSECVFEVDFRLPNGAGDDVVETRIEAIKSRFPHLQVERITYNPPSWSPPDHDLLQRVRANGTAITGIDPAPVVALTATDSRLWRYHDIPAYVYGPAPKGMGSFDEQVDVEEALNVVKVHLLSAWDYLTGAA